MLGEGLINTSLDTLLAATSIVPVTSDTHPALTPVQAAVTVPVPTVVGAKMVAAPVVGLNFPVKAPDPVQDTPLASLFKLP